MKLVTEEHGQVAVVRPTGDLTAEETESFRKAARERLNTATRDFVIDGSEMEFIDSQGLETLLWLQESTAEQLGQVRLAKLTENVTQILSITRLAMRFETHDTVEEALKHLG